MKLILGIFLVASAIVFGILYLTKSIHGQKENQVEKQNKERKDEAPVLDYESEIQKSADKKSSKKTKYFNSLGITPVFPDKQIAELPEDNEPLPTIDHWWVGLPALPVAQSDAVVMGEITDTAAHLSENRKEIYSEFLVDVTEIFKDAGGSVRVDDTISAHRAGGSVRFTSGRVNKYRISKQGMPQRGEDYVLFLKQIEGNDYLILTGYKLSNGKVTPLDGEGNPDPRADLPFAKYRGGDKTVFLQDLQTALQASTNEGGDNQ